MLLLFRVRINLVARHCNSGNLDQYSSVIRNLPLKGPDKNWRLLSKATVTLLPMLSDHTYAMCALTSAHRARSPPACTSRVSCSFTRGVGAAQAESRRSCRNHCSELKDSQLQIFTLKTLLPIYIRILN